MGARWAALVVWVLALVAPLSGAWAQQWVPAGAIGSSSEAERVCRAACGGFEWDGNWRTAGAGAETECSCTARRSSINPRGRATEIEAGPIWDDNDAADKCPRVCGAVNWWNGQWRSTQGGNQAVCGCVWDRGQTPPGGIVTPVDAGILWSDADAQNMCPRVCGGSDRWTGNWRTVSPGRSTCDCRMGR